MRFVLSGRNVLALAAARAALAAVQPGAAPPIIPIADIFLDRERLATAGGFALTAFFPEKVTVTAWEGLAHLTAPGGIVIAGMSSAEAERFDRKKPPAWHRIGDIKRKGFRAIAYQVLEKDKQ